MTSYCRRWEISFYTLFPLLSSHYSYSKIVFISFRLCTHRSDEVSSALQLHFLIKHSIFPRIKKCPFSFYLLDFFLTYVLLINLQCLWQQKKKNCFQTCQVTVSSFSSLGLTSGNLCLLLSFAPAVPQAFRVAVILEPVFTIIVRIPVSLLFCIPSLTLDLLHICETHFSFFLRKCEREVSFHRWHTWKCFHSVLALVW